MNSSTNKPTTFNTNVAIATIGGGSSNKQPTKADFNFGNMPALRIVDQARFSDYIGLDTSKNYTLDVDDFSLSDGTTTTQKAITPGIYLLRDIQHLTLTSSSKVFDVYDHPVELIVTPYAGSSPKCWCKLNSANLSFHKLKHTGFF